MVSAAVTRHGLTGCFVFEVAVPDAMQWLKSDIAVFTRHSDVEDVPAVCDHASAELDAF